jgi:NhaA family Na+:H+ antiporter
VKVNEEYYAHKLDLLLQQFRDAEPNKNPLVTNEQLHILEEIREISKKALTPLQRMEHSMHPFVAYIIMPVFALSNAGVEISPDFLKQATSPVAMGVFFGLLAGKFFGVIGIVSLFLKMKWAALPLGMTRLHLIGAGLLAAIGFTMSLFISDLAFVHKEHLAEARIGILGASVLASFAGYFIIKYASEKKDSEILK